MDFRSEPRLYYRALSWRTPAQASLHDSLRLLRTYLPGYLSEARHHSPRVRTSCCKSLHCFNCKTVGFHDGRTCAQVAEARAADYILPCPKCGTSIVKGDGCGSIACICGHGFSWSLELKKLREPKDAIQWGA